MKKKENYFKNTAIIIILKHNQKCFALIFNVKLEIMFRLLIMTNLVMFGIYLFHYSKLNEGVHPLIAIYELILFVLLKYVSHIYVKLNTVVIFIII